MTNPIPVYETSLRINTFECDFNHRWKPAAFFQHLTEAAGQHAARLGFGYAEMYAQNLFWVHSRMKIQFLRFPNAGDVITIHTWPKTVQQKLFYIRDFEVFNAAGDCLAAATSAWLVMDATARRLVTPLSLNLQIPARSDRVGLDEPLEKLSGGEDGAEVLRVQAGYSAVDILGHVNNSRYVEWVCDAFPVTMYSQQQIDWLQINYDREIRPGDSVSIRAQQSAETLGRWAVTGLNQTNDTSAFQAAVQWKEG